MSKSGNENRSVRNTKKRLREGLLTLLQQKPIKEITVNSNNYAQTVKAIFDRDVYLNGNFYVSVTAVSEKGYFRIEDLTSEHTAIITNLKKKHHVAQEYK